MSYVPHDEEIAEAVEAPAPQHETPRAQIGPIQWFTPDESQLVDRTLAAVRKIEEHVNPSAVIDHSRIGHRGGMPFVEYIRLLTPRVVTAVTRAARSDLRAEAANEPDGLEPLTRRAIAETAPPTSFALAVVTSPIAPCAPPRLLAIL